MHSATNIWNFFKAIFPSVANEVKQFKSHGQDAITLWFSDRQPVIFTILPNKAWKLEPYTIKRS